jgi:hypothetical protein
VNRPLTLRERAALDHLLALDFPGALELRAQAASVEATGVAMFVELSVDHSLPKAAVLNRTPVQAVVDGHGYDGGLLLFVEEGRLSGLEYWWVTEEMPAEFPPVDIIGSPLAFQFRTDG